MRRAAIAFLVALEFVYVIALASSLLGAAVCGVLFWQGRRSGARIQAPARGLLLCTGSLLAMGVAELFVGVPRAWAARAGPPVASEPAPPEEFPESPSSGELYLVVLGESSAYGTPFEKRFSVGKIVAWQLEQAIPGLKMRVEIIARPGDTLKGQYQKLARLTRRPDAIIVYCGHNEFASDIPWSRRVLHYLDEKPSLLRRIDELAGAISPLCRLMRETADRFRSAVVPPPGLNPPLVDSPSYTPQEYSERLIDFRERLEAIASYCERIGALPILVLPPANDAGFDPSRSFLPPDTTKREREAFAREFLAARAVENTDPDHAIELYRSLLAMQPGFAETHYRLACLLADADDWDAAYEHFVRARDRDGLPMRCMSEFQDAYRQVAARDDCVFVDGQALFHAVEPHGLLDDHLFQDGMHPSMLGQITLAQAILDGLHARSLGLAGGLACATNRPRGVRSSLRTGRQGLADHRRRGAVVPVWQRVAEVRFQPAQGEDAGIRRSREPHAFGRGA